MSEIDDLMAKISKFEKLEQITIQDVEEFLYTDESSYLCLDSDLLEPLYRLVGKGEFKSKLEDFLLSQL